MKRLVLVLAAPLMVAACGGASSSAPPHIVAAGAPAQVLAPAVTLPPITAPPAVEATPPPVVRVSRSAPRPRPAAVTGDIWGALARCESGGNATAVSGSGRYFGAFQFSIGTWQSLGYSGNPIDHPYETQLAAAQKLQARSGWGQWPVCAGKLGLR